MKRANKLLLLLIICFISFQIYFFIQTALVVLGKQDAIDPHHIVVIYVLIVVTYLLFFYFSNSVYQAGKVKEELKWLAQQEMLQRNEVEQLQHTQKLMQQKNSELLLQLKNLLDQLDSDITNADTFYLYAQELHQNLQNSQAHRYCYNSTINAILHIKKTEAEKNKIQVTYAVTLPEQISIPDYILACIFFNLLDNGIEACLRSEADVPFLKLVIGWKADMLFINMENSKNEKEVFTGKSTKASGKDHGVGISIIETIVQQNDGSVQWIDHCNAFSSILMMHYRHT